MALYYAGIDEAGYGPLLGPFCSGMSVWRIERWSPGEPAPDLWQLLEKAVCPALKGARGRIAIADSKAIKLANTAKQPLLHLERGVLACAAQCLGAVADDAALLGAMGCGHGAAPWYGGEPLALPLANEPGLLAIDGNVLAGAMASCGVTLVAMRCVVMDEGRFNETVLRAGSKGEVTLAGVREHLGFLKGIVPRGEHVRVVGDRLGGRQSYARFLEGALGGAVEVLEESERVSRYDCEGVGVQFLPEAETQHGPVALASMIAKFARELAMLRFNRYWCGRGAAERVELKPTAGYRQDAARWLADAKGLVSAEDRRAMVRQA